jgi:hypothetical protein
MDSEDKYNEISEEDKIRFKQIEEMDFKVN